MGVPIAGGAPPPRGAAGPGPAGRGPDPTTRLKQGSVELQRRSGNLRPPGYYERRRENQLKAIAQVKSESDRMEGMQAFVEKREADYAGPVKSEAPERLY